MKQNLTELVFILDPSGSMQGLEGDTIGGFNAMLEKQEKAPGKAYVSTVLFDDQAEVLHDRVKEMIRRQKEQYGWEFLFLGANIDAVEMEGYLGIVPDRAVNCHCDSVGARLNYQVAGRAVAAVRRSAPLDARRKDAMRRISAGGRGRTGAVKPPDPPDRPPAAHLHFPADYGRRTDSRTDGTHRQQRCSVPQDIPPASHLSPSEPPAGRRCRPR